MEAMDDFKSFHSNVSSSLVSATRSTNRLCAEDLGFHRSLDPTLATLLDDQNARLLKLTERLLANAAQGSEVRAPSLSDTDTVESNWRGIIDVVDNLLEKADSSLDEYTGVIKRLSPGAEASAKSKYNDSKLQNIIRSRDIDKPQLKFEFPPRNDYPGPFQPLISAKPHSKISLKKTLKTITDEEGQAHFPHPYQSEIESYEYPAAVYHASEPRPYLPFESTSATFVETEEDVKKMLEELKGSKEIAIDLEHHDNRSYMGIVSLMQISTRTKDWIVDTLRPWRRRLECLNEVFTDPKILKVLHGAYMDIIWLQRDLGLYVVGLFDTFFAARSLQYPGASLAFLLDKFIGFKAEKKYQMADWRIRPLPEEMFKYARSDTHFLLYIYDCMRNELIEKSDFSNPESDRIRWVLDKSKETALQRYDYPIYDRDTGSGPVGWMKLIYRNPAMFSKEQFSVFRAVHQWRDKVAREEDESPVYVLSNHALFGISRAMPCEKASLMSVTNPISPLLRRHASEVIGLISTAKEAAQNDPDVPTFLAQLNQKEEAARTSHDLPKVNMPSENTKSEALSITGLLPSRSSISRFWGKTVNENGAFQSNGSTQLNVPLAIGFPLSKYGNVQDTAEPLPHEAQSEFPDYMTIDAQEGKQEKGDDDIFILKEMKRKRKLADVDAAQSAKPDSDMHGDNTKLLTDESQELLDQKALSKAARKAAKKAKKKEMKAALKETQENEANNADDGSSGLTDTPFDYSSAPNLLHTQSQTSSSSKGGANKNAFNPYKKALNTPKGLPRAQRERAGKSGSFK